MSSLHHRALTRSSAGLSVIHAHRMRAGRQQQCNGKVAFFNREILQFPKLLLGWLLVASVSVYSARSSSVSGIRK